MSEWLNDCGEDHEELCRDAVGPVEAERDELRRALVAIRDYPVGNPVAEFVIRKIAALALNGSPFEGATQR